MIWRNCDFSYELVISVECFSGKQLLTGGFSEYFFQWTLIMIVCVCGATHGATITPVLAVASRVSSMRAASAILSRFKIVTHGMKTFN